MIPFVGGSRKRRLPLRVFGRQRNGLKTYGLITLACALISVLFHLLSTGLSQVSDISEQLINQAAENAVSEQIQNAARGR